VPRNFQTVSEETVEKVNGKITPRVVEKDGPTGLIVATTKPTLHSENETRLLSLRVDDSATHVKAIMRSVATRSRDEVDYSEWRALQTWIAGQSNRVVVPYALPLVELIPPVDIRINRDVELLLNAIEAHAILHQATRERDEAGKIVATLDDYAAVRGIVSDVMSAAVATRVPAQLREVVRAVRALLDDDKPVSLAAVKRVTGWSKGKAQNWFKAARDEGYIVGENVGRGKTAEYSMGADLPADRDLLPTVDALKAAINGDEPPDPTPDEPAPSQNGHAPEALPVDKASTHTYDYSRRAYTSGGKIACLNDDLRGNMSCYLIDSVDHPREVANMVRTEGLRAAVKIARRAGISDAYRYVVDTFRRDVEYDAISAGTTIIEAQGFDGPTPADNAEVDWRPVFAAETKFVLRRIAELRRDGYTREARALRSLLPGRLAWREWTGTLTDRDRRHIAEAEARAAAMDAARQRYEAEIRSGELPDPETTPLGDMLMACIRADARRATLQDEGGAV
jgi:hypothetical protein